MGAGSLVVLLNWVVSPAPTYARASHPPEEERFDNTEFRSELLRRGLDELLDYYKQTRPPAPRGIDAELFRREQLLETYRDASLTASERVAALEEAISILEALVRGDSGPPRSWQWQLQLGKDLLFLRAEPMSKNILYRGWTRGDAEALKDVSAHAEQIFVALRDETGSFQDRLNQDVSMTEAQYRRLERKGLPDAADRFKRQSEYFLQWSRFYRALSMNEEEHAPQRRILREIIRFIEKGDPPYAEMPHERTGVQAQSLLLLGMCRRMLGHHENARENLVQARNVVSNLSDAEQRSLRWVYVLAHLEAAKAFYQEGNFPRARKVLRIMRKWRQQQMPDNFALALALALLDATITEHHAQSARMEGAPRQADKLLAERHRPLVDLLFAEPEHQSEVFQAVYARLDGDADPRSLDAMESNALIAGLLGEVAELKARTGSEGDDAETRRAISRKLQRLLDVGRHALTDTSETGRALKPITLFNVGVAYYQLGRPARAVRHFVELVREHPDFDRRSTALDYAVRIAADWIAQDAETSDPRRWETFVLALQTLDEVAPDSEQAGYWRYYLADGLARLGKLEESAAVFHRVPPTSENYASAAYLEVVKRWELHQRELVQGAGRDQLHQRLKDVIDAARRCRKLLAGEIENSDGAPSGELPAYQGGALLLRAEAFLQPAYDQPQQTLDLLDGFEQRFADQATLIGRALRLRIVAHQRLGQLDEAGRIIDLYLEREPDSAGAVMDGLLSTMMQEVRRMRDAGRAYDEAARDALSLARKLNTWAREHPHLLGGMSADAFQVRLAGAHLLAGNLERALEIAARCVQRDAARQPDGRSADVEALHHQAEALYQLERHAQAQPIFYDLWARLPEGTDMWWQALLRSLQCHSAMNSDPGRIVAEIRKLRHAFPDMGGATLKAQFEELERENARKIASRARGPGS